MEKFVYLAADCDERLVQHLSDIGYEVRMVRTNGIVSDPVSNHPDIFMCKLGINDDAEIVSYWDQPSVQLDGSVEERANAVTVLAKDYPHDIPYNAACTGKYFIHNLKHTAPVLLDRARDKGMMLIDVRQGYAKCSTVIVDEVSIITYDQGLGQACIDAGLDVLMVSPGNIVLPGFNTGFIGGASGRIDNTVIFNGDLSAHPDYERIVDFIQKKGLEVKWFSNWPLTDIGSIICGC